MNVTATTWNNHRVPGFSVDTSVALNLVGFNDFVKATDPRSISYETDTITLHYRDDTAIQLLGNIVELYDQQGSVIPHGHLVVDFRNEQATVEGGLYIIPDDHKPTIGHETYDALTNGPRRMFLGDITSYFNK